MTDHDLLDRMARSTDWTNDLQTDPAADIARGRSRLLRRRAGVGAATAAAAAFAAAALIVPASLGGGVAESAVATGAGEAGRSFPVRPGATADEVARSAVAWKNLEVVLSHIDPKRTHVAPGSYRWGEAYICAADPGVVEARVPWEQGGRTGAVTVTILDKSVRARIGTTRTAARACVNAGYPSQREWTYAYQIKPDLPLRVMYEKYEKHEKGKPNETKKYPAAYVGFRDLPDGDHILVVVAGHPLDKGRPVADPAVTDAQMTAAVRDKALVPIR